MSFDLQKQNVAVHASRLNPEFRKAIYSGSEAVNLKPLIISSKLNSKNFTEEKSLLIHNESLLLSDSRMYALKKRLLAPSWWVEGILLSLGAKEAWFDSLISKRAGKFIAAPEKINAKNIALMFAIWHEALSLIYSMQTVNNVLRFKINKYIVGTQKDITEKCKQLESIWSTPLKLFEVKSAKKNNKNLALSKIGQLGFVRSVNLENDVDGIWLNITLSNDFKDFYLPSELKSEANLNKPSFVSINPVVIQSMGNKASIKKILNYLFLEYAKQENREVQSNWNSIHIDIKNICNFHKEILTNVPSLYDHGVLGWSVAAPNMKLSELKQKMSEKLVDSTQTSHLGSVVYCWNLSEQAKEAQELEHALADRLTEIHHETIYSPRKLTLPNSFKISTPSLRQNSTLFPEPPADELKVARKIKAVKAVKAKKVEKLEKFEKTEKREKKSILPKESIVTKKTLKKTVVQTLFDNTEVKNAKKIEPVVRKKTILKKSAMSPKNVLSDDEFIILVSEFYESLKPLQKKAFERERACMTAEQFRAFMTPILKRKKTVKAK